jgi:hypothetical protein
MARPYRDAAELATTPVDRAIHPLVTEGAAILLGISFPAVDGPVPIMLVPGYEYRLRHVPAPGHEREEDREAYWTWVLERRSV